MTIKKYCEEGEFLQEYNQAVSSMKDWSLSQGVLADGSGKSSVGFLVDLPSSEDVKYRTPFAPSSFRGELLDMILDMGLWIKDTGEHLGRQNMLFDYCWPIAPGTTNPTTSRISTAATCCDFNLNRLRQTIGKCGLVVCPGNLSYATASMLQDCYCPDMKVIFSFNMTRTTINSVIPTPFAMANPGGGRHGSLLERAKWITRRIVLQSQGALDAPWAFV